MKYFIVKASRTSQWPYTGPTCRRAGVEEGKIYNTIEEAQKDAKQLTKYNPVGFKVYVVEK